MKIAVVHTSVPFYRGGAEVLADGTYDKLREAGHEVTYYRIPFSWNPSEKVIQSLLAVRGMCFDKFDRVIGFKFPTYCVDHPHKTIWLIHQFRQAYDCWGTLYQDIPDTASGQQIRHAIFAADKNYLGTVKNLFCISEVIAERLSDFNGIKAQVLYHPLPDTSNFCSGEYQNYIFYPSRICTSKRQLLIVDAMRFVKSPVKLVLAGMPESKADLLRITDLIDKYHLHKKVTVYDRFISEQEKIQLMSNALAIAYLPYDEDSYGYVTLEAYYCRRPVITCTDSGGTHILVKDRQSGAIVEPDPKALAEMIDEMYRNKSKLASMGNAGFEISQKLEINWENVTRKLTQ